MNTLLSKLSFGKRYAALFCLCVVFGSTLFGQTSYENTFYSYEHIPSYTETDVKNRLLNLNLCISPQYSSIVKSYVKTYMVSNRQKASNIIGKTVMYFPVFEKYLRERGLPADLKYVSVLESALTPTATSRSNAVGLWQFMAATAREYGLQINSTVDERNDPHRSTQAALTYLERLHNKYGDWALALAAYNGGPGRVNRAIKRARSKSFSRVSKYLPRETRNYIPAFFAAAYLINHHQDHGIVGEYPELDMQITDVTKVYQGMTFDEISKITGVSVWTIEALNPSYKKQIIPSSQRGNYVILPQRVMGTFLNYLQYPDRHQDIIYSTAPTYTSRAEEHFFKTTYRVKDQDNIHTLAKVFKCSSYNIRAWNHLSSDYIHPGQELTIYQPFVTSEYPTDTPSTISAYATTTTTVAPPSVSRPIMRKYKIVPIAKPSVKTIDAQTTNTTNRSLKSLMDESFVYYQILRGESLSDVADKFPDVRLEDILQLNGWRGQTKSVKPGTRIKVKKL